MEAAAPPAAPLADNGAGVASSEDKAKTDVHADMAKACVHAGTKTQTAVPPLAANENMAHDPQVQHMTIPFVSKV